MKHRQASLNYDSMIVESLTIEQFCLSQELALCPPTLRFRADFEGGMDRPKAGSFSFCCNTCLQLSAQHSSVQYFVQSF